MVKFSSTSNCDRYRQYDWHRRVYESWLSADGCSTGSAILLLWVIGGIAALCGVDLRRTRLSVAKICGSTTSWGACIIPRWGLFLAGFLSPSDLLPQLRSPR